MRHYVVPIVRLAFPGSRPPKDFPQGRPITYAVINHKWGIPATARCFYEVEGTLAFIGGGADKLADGSFEDRMTCLLRETREELPESNIAEEICAALQDGRECRVLEIPDHTFTFLPMPEIKDEMHARQFLCASREGYIGFYSLAQYYRFHDLKLWMIQDSSVIDTLVEQLNRHS